MSTLSPDSITAYVTAVTTFTGAAGVAYARWNRRARRTLRAMRKALQQNREALEVSVEGWATARRIAIAEGVDPKKLPRIPRKVLVLTAADDEPESTTGGGTSSDPQT